MKDELSKKLEAEVAELAEKKGRAVMYSAAGPAGMGLVRLMATMIQNQDSRIAELEARLRVLENR